jgi:hypothetical protein
MTREDAERRASALNAQHPGEHWFARDGADGWEAVKVLLPPGVRLTPIKETVETKARFTDAPPPTPQRFFDAGPGAGH